ncbi:hypothetical protein A3860_27660 [Niastella vici]|uniref:Uncharacterized protein n=1 Tax=Niastella vici TaxID=1703345 RepID=A0A1V9FVV1_9BACT|nr:hypothetical protein [Niastella vici]OQP62473.1 hypothetical protein A3860_27660 [Niastella vici]
MKFPLPSYEEQRTVSATFPASYPQFYEVVFTNVRMTIIILKSFFKWGFFNISFFTFAPLKNQTY